jgi:hypothetical protein
VQGSRESEAFETPRSFAGVPEVIQDRTLTGRVSLDNRSFERCRFRSAVLVYGGGIPPRLSDCVFERASFEFSGAASRTLAFLQAMSDTRSGLRGMVKASFPALFGH